MATIRQSRSGWQATIRRKGHKTICKNFPKKALAERWALEQERKVVALVEYRKKVGSGPLGHFINDYLLRVEDWRDPLWDSLLRSAKSRAKKKGFEFTLTYPQYLDLVAGSENRCAVTHIPFNTWTPTPLAGRKRYPFSPSVDRIDSSKGYIAGNVRIVCYTANLAMSHWGELVLITMLTGHNYYGDST